MLKFFHALANKTFKTAIKSFQMRYCMKNYFKGHYNYKKSILAFKIY